MTMRTNILTSTRGEETGLGAGHPSTSHEHKGTGQGEEDVQISDYRA
jgi:hypothetical protein